LLEAFAVDAGTGTLTYVPFPSQGLPTVYKLAPDCTGKFLYGRNYGDIVAFTTSPNGSLTVSSETTAPLCPQSASCASLSMTVACPAAVTGPVSRVSPLSSVEYAISFPVQWSGMDSSSTISGYTIYVSYNGGPFTAWLTNTTATEATFTGVSGHSYGFYSIAMDAAGNVEAPKYAAEATIYVDAMKPISHTSSPGSPPSPNFLVQWSGNDIGGPGIARYDIYISDNGGPFALWQTSTAPAQAWVEGYLGHTYRFFSQATDTYGIQENLKTVVDATTQTPPAGIPEDVFRDGYVNCVDIAFVEAAMGSTPGRSNWNPAADVNRDGVVNVKDLALVSQMLIPGWTCN
jgi:hypothetical protein